MEASAPAYERTDSTDETVAYILGEHVQRYAPEDKDLLARAFEFARERHSKQKRANGDPYITHCIEVARILAERRLDVQTLAAALLHDTIEDCGDVSFASLSEQFGGDIAELVEGVTKLSSLNYEFRHEQQAESLRKMILAMSKDIRVLIIKLADRLHNMRTLRFLKPEKQLKISQDTMDVFAPLANRLGMTRIKSELEDAAMRFLYPYEYKQLAAQVAMKKAEREDLVQRSTEMLEKELKAHNITAEIKGRSKHLYSIFLKMKKSDLTISEIYDLIGLRVICEEKSTCYDILGIVHNLWRPIPGRFKDYIAMPKENMYQSLHTTVVGVGGERLEIQVRTADMHRFAEEGIAAHWKYKEGRTSRLDIEDKLAWLRRLTDIIENERDPGDFMTALKDDISVDTIFCFTPQGDVIELPYGATPVDFAYAVHTRVGETCSGARINGKMVSLKTFVSNGDFVEVVTSKSAHPTADWLDWVKTSRARSKIKHWLKTQYHGQNLEKGRELISKALRARSIPLVWEEFEEKISPHLKAFKMTSFEDLMAEIGFGGTSATNVVARAYPEPVSTPRPKPVKGSRGRRNRSQGIVVAGISNTAIRFAGCCSPVPGDPIIGYITIGRGVTIHHKDCSSFLKAQNACNGADHRVVEAQWDMNYAPLRLVTIRVECQDRRGLLADITGVITSMNVFIQSSKTDSRADTAVLKFSVEVKNADHLSQLMNQLRQVKSVLKVTRMQRSTDPG